MAEAAGLDFFTGPTAQEKLRTRAQEMMYRDPKSAAHIAREAAAIERGERTLPEYEADLARDKVRKMVFESAQALGVKPADNPSDFADVAISTIMRQGYPGAERDAMLVLQWKQLQGANKRAGELTRANAAQSLHGYTPESMQEFEKTGDYSRLKADPNAGGKGRGEYYVPVQTAAGVKAFDARTGRVLDPATGKPIGSPVIGSPSDVDLQRRLAANKKAGEQAGEEQRLVDGKLDAIDAVGQGLQMLDDGIYTGGWAEWKLKAAKLGPLDKTRAANTERFQAYLGDVIIPGLRDFGGNDSNEERAYLEKVRGGKITMEEPALRKILENAERNITRGIARARKRAREAGLPRDESPAPAEKRKPAAPGLPAGWKVRTK